MSEIDAAAWNELVAGDSPFWDHAFLSACEEASATAEHGILPRHMTLWDGDQLLAVVPLYVKGDGRAEFIYDYGWYHLAWQVGIEYYPKAVSMAPFTPVTGCHFFFREGVDKAEAIPALVELMERWAVEVGLTGIHFLFATEEEADVLGELGYLRRLTFQLSLTNRFDSFDDYLAGFRSKDRIKIKRLVDKRE